jgi:hypothetical protein
MSVPGICAALSFVASKHIESAYNWSRQPKKLLGELGFELSSPGRTTQDVD